MGWGRGRVESKRREGPVCCGVFVGCLGSSRALLCQGKESNERRQERESKRAGAGCPLFRFRSSLPLLSLPWTALLSVRPSFPLSLSAGHGGGTKAKTRHDNDAPLHAPLSLARTPPSCSDGNRNAKAESQGPGGYKLKIGRERMQTPCPDRSTASQAGPRTHWNAYRTSPRTKVSLLFTCCCSACLFSLHLLLKRKGDTVFGKGQELWGKQTTPPLPTDPTSPPPPPMPPLAALSQSSTTHLSLLPGGEGLLHLALEGFAREARGAHDLGEVVVVRVDVEGTEHALDQVPDLVLSVSAATTDEGICMCKSVRAAGWALTTATRQSLGRQHTPGRSRCSCP